MRFTSRFFDIGPCWLEPAAPTPIALVLKDSTKADLFYSNSPRAAF
jgi:hypothetical protein